MKAAVAALCPALLLAGIATASPYEAPYRAVGTEPRWALTIDRWLIRYVGDEGRTRVTTAAPEARPSFNGRRYVTPRITIDVTRGQCSDGLSDRLYPERVMVTVGRRTVHGCGGDPIVAPAPQPILSGQWRITSVDGRPLAGPRVATISFTDGRIGGSTGCNSFGGSFGFERGFLSVGPLMSTKMACLGSVMGQEQAILHLLGERLSVSSNREGKLVLSTRGGETMVLARADPGA